MPYRVFACLAIRDMYAQASQDLQASQVPQVGLAAQASMGPEASQVLLCCLVTVCHQSSQCMSCSTSSVRWETPQD